MNSDIRVYLMILTGYKPTPTVGKTDLYFGTHEYITQPYDSIPNQYFEPRISNPGVFSQSMYSPGTTGGNSSGGYGVIDLINTDGGLDDLCDWGLAGWPCVMYEGPLGGAFADFAVIMTGTIEQVEHTWNTVTFRYKDLTAALDTEMAPYRYTGSNVLPDGLEGTSEIRDKPKPRLLGYCFNITPTLVNSAKLIYQISDEGSTTVTEVRDNGVPLDIGNPVTLEDLEGGGIVKAFTVTPPSNLLNFVTEHGLQNFDEVTIYSSSTYPAPLVQNRIYYVRFATLTSIVLHYTYDDAVDKLNEVDITTTGSGTMYVLKGAAAKGTWDYCYTNGYIRLGSKPKGQITCDAYVNESLAQILSWLVIGKLGADAIVGQSLNDLNAAYVTSGYYLGGHVGMYISSNDSSTTKEIFDTLAKAGFWWGFDNDGKFWAKQFTAPEANTNPILYLTDDHILQIERLATMDSDKGVPIWRVVCRYCKNHTVQTTVAGSIDANLYNQEWKTAIYENPNIKVKYPSAGELIIDTPFKLYGAALQEAYRQFLLRSVRRDRLRVTLSLSEGGPLSYPSGGYWDDEAITEMPTARYAFSPIVVGNWLYAIGGISTYSALKTNSRFNLDSLNSQWETGFLPDLPDARYNHVALEYNGWLYLVGGVIATVPTASVIRINLSNPVAWDTTGVPNLPQPITLHSAVSYNGWIYLIGGHNGTFSTNKTYGINLNSPTLASDSWNDGVIPDLAFSHANGSAIIFENWLYVSNESMVQRINLDSISSWDYIGVSDLPYSLIYHKLAIANRYLYCIAVTPVDHTLMKIFRLNLSNPTSGWISMTELPNALQSMGVVSYQGSIFVVGGFITNTTDVQTNTYKLRTNSNPEDRAQLNSIGRTVRLTLPRYGYKDGKNMKIIGSETNHKERTTTLELWG